MGLLKNKPVIILGICCLVLLFINMQSCSQGKKCLQAKQKGEIKLYDAEKALNDTLEAKSGLEARLGKTEAALAEVRSALETAQKALLQEQMINKSLNVEIEKLRALNNALENDLKDAVASGKVKK